MPNGDDDKYNTEWCKDKHQRIDEQLAELWGEEHGGLKAVWKNIDRLNAKLWGIIGMQLMILGGIVATLLRLSI